MSFLVSARPVAALKFRTAIPQEGRQTAEGGEYMNPVALVQAWWAKEHITLAKEPPGSRRGLCSPPDQGRDLEPLTMLVVGDSMAVGCGVEDQSQGFVPET